MTYLKNKNKNNKYQPNFSNFFALKNGLWCKKKAGGELKYNWGPNT